jgi:hypothetical protein
MLGHNTRTHRQMWIMAFLNPIEQVFVDLKSLLREAEPTVSSGWEASLIPDRTKDQFCAGHLRIAWANVL